MENNWDRWVCWSCGETFICYIDGCPKCGSQIVSDRFENQ